MKKFCVICRKYNKVFNTTLDICNECQQFLSLCNNCFNCITEKLVFNYKPKFKVTIRKNYGCWQGSRLVNYTKEKNFDIDKVRVCIGSRCNNVN